MKPQNTDDMLTLLDYFLVSASFGTALELGLFRLLDGRKLTADQVSKELKIPGYRCHYWLQLLEQYGLLDRFDDMYSISGIIKKAVLGTYSDQTWALLAEESRSNFPCILDLTHTIKNPTSNWKIQKKRQVNYVQKMMSDLDQARRFTRMLYEIHQPLALEIADVLDLRGVNKMMDLGGGSGVNSMVLLDRYPSLSVVVIDIETVCYAGSEIATERGLNERITYYAVDFLNETLPAGFDLILECDVNIYTEDLFRKVFDALTENGQFIIIDQFAQKHGVANPARVNWAFEGSMNNPEYTPPTKEEVLDALKRSGFKVVRTDILAPKENRWSSAMDMIISRKMT